MGNQRYNASPTSLATGALTLQYISSSKYEGDWPSAPHAHPCTELFYVISGEGSFQIQELAFSVAPNDLIVINPNVLHTETALNTSPMEYIVAGIEGADFLGKGSNDLRFCHFSCGEMGERVSFYMQEILAELKNGQPYCDNIATGWLHILVAKLQRYKEITLTIKPPEKTSLESAQIKHYIDKHFKEDLSLDTLSKVAHLNKFYLSHIFKRDHGISPINYLISRRIRESKFLLQDTDYSISQISQFVGFSSPSYFSQCFNRLEEISPKAYRRQFQQKEQR